MNVTEYIEKVMPGMEGWCSKDKASKLAAYAKEANTFVEIGVFGGRSLFAGSLAQPEGAIAIGIDPWKAAASVKGFNDKNAEWWGKLNHDEIYDKCRKMLDTLNLNSQCQLLRCTATEALPLIRRLAPIDLAHIDGNHSEESALADVENYMPLVREGGVVFFDDTDWYTTKKAQARLLDFCTPLEMIGSCGVLRRK